MSKGLNERKNDVLSRENRMIQIFKIATQIFWSLKKASTLLEGLSSIHELAGEAANMEIRP